MGAVTGVVPRNVAKYVVMEDGQYFLRMHLDDVEGLTEGQCREILRMLKTKHDDVKPGGVRALQQRLRAKVEKLLGGGKPKAPKEEAAPPKEWHGFHEGQEVVYGDEEDAGVVADPGKLGPDEKLAKGQVRVAYGDTFYDLDADGLTAA